MLGLLFWSFIEHPRADTLSRSKSLRCQFACRELLFDQSKLSKLTKPNDPPMFTIMDHIWNFDRTLAELHVSEPLISNVN
jgi:hypothetical protein